MIAMSHECNTCGREFDTQRGLSLHESSGHDDPWKDKDRLERLYIDHGLTLDEMADRLGCDRTVVHHHLNEFGIERRPSNGVPDDAPHKDPDTLRELYHDKGLSTHEIADRFGVMQSTISYWMNKHDVERRTPNQEKPPYFHTTKHGHEELQTTVGNEREHVFVHQLLAISEGADPYKVFDPVEYVCHHENHIPWDNRPGNVVVWDRAAHQSHHAGGGPAKTT